MSFYSTVQKINGFYEFPRIGKNKFKPLRVTDLRDPRIQEAFKKSKSKYQIPMYIINYLSYGVMLSAIRKAITLQSLKETLSSKMHTRLRLKPISITWLKTVYSLLTIDPNLISVEAMAELFRNLPRKKAIYSKSKWSDLYDE